MLWLQARKHRLVQPKAHLPGSVNVKTGKRYLGDGYAPRTINHNLSVVREFYEFHIAAGRGPVRNLVPARRDRRTGNRFAAQHNPLEPFEQTARAPYRQKEPRRRPRSLPDAAVEELFGALRCHRDRALIAFYLSTGARPTELSTVTNKVRQPPEAHA